ncbi:MAG: glycosyl hydrolase family 18 protein, partial [Candidatus Shapirobacteria bacterium]
MKKILGFLGLIIILGLIYFLIWGKDNSFLLNPLSNNSDRNSQENNLETVGFLPPWMVGKTRLYGSELDELIFLGIEVDESGNLVWDMQSKKIGSEEFLKQKENITKTGGKNILGIKLFKDESLDKFLGNEVAVNNLINQVRNEVIENNFDGVNIDFEYQNDPVAILNQNFLNFLEKMRQAEVGEISVDVFVNTINKGSTESLIGLIERVDSLIIMAYDFHRPGVDYAGAVAPIEAPIGERSILEVVTNITNIHLDKDKIVLAFPLYGYEWKTETKEFGSQIKRGWYQMASWDRTKKLIEEKDLEVKWNELSMTPWLVFEEEDEIHQIYYENEKSLDIKLKLAKDNKFLGVGFWALGYEGKEN